MQFVTVDVPDNDTNRSLGGDAGSEPNLSENNDEGAASMENPTSNPKKPQSLETCLRKAKAETKDMSEGNELVGILVL